MTVKKSLRKVKSSFKEDEKSSDSDTKTDDDDITRTSSDFGLHSPSLNPAGLMPRKRSGSLAIHRSSDGSQSMVLSKSDDSRLFGSKEEAFLATLSEPEVIVISKGKAAIKELFLPPPPAPDISHILSVPSSTSYSTMKSPRSPRGQKNSKDSITSLNKSPTPKTSKMSGTVSSTVNLIRSKEKLIQPNREKYCLPGINISPHLANLHRKAITHLEPFCRIIIIQGRRKLFFAGGEPIEPPLPPCFLHPCHCCLIAMLIIKYVVS